MDVLTQGLVGGVLAQSLARKNEKKIATLVGVLAGLLADADILIRSSSDPLLNIEYHRHFTHSLVFIPLGAAIAMLLLWPFVRRHLSARRLYLFSLAGYSMSGVLDAFTSYGTHLFWPFSDERVALNIISIVDPVFTLILLVTLLTGLRLGYRKVAYAGLVLSMMYLGMGFVQLQRAEQLAEDLRDKRGHLAMQSMVKPTLANLVLWRSVYIHEDRIHVDAIRVGLFDAGRVIEGESVALFSFDRDLPQLDESSVLYRDIVRFWSFSDGYVALDPVQTNVLGDIRYSMLPVSARPLWGIVIDPDRPQVHADYRFFRDSSPSVRETFLNLLLD
ncbi:MAG: metal-dependent hydrolase [Deltaproteobacteria bacterium]|jgi:inner membrane protein|nr:metal-dependent hydrolase [Deltaproteobacteria bacterium]